MNRKRILVTALCALLAQVVSAGVEGDFSDWFYYKTLRMDYIHSGTSTGEQIVYERFLEEPYWGGSKVHLRDTFGYGDYHLEVLDSASGVVLYSRGYSTLFAEWQDTDEAKAAERSFNEAVVMPYPRVPVQIRIYRRDKRHQMGLVFVIHFNEKTHLAEVRAPLSYPVIDIMITGPSSERLDVLFIAEGYRITDREKFLLDCTRFAGYLVGASPFRDYRTQINIRAIMTISEDSLVSRPPEGIECNTAVGVSFHTFGSERYLMAFDFQRVRDIAGLAPYDQIVILVNSDDYGGGGIFNYYATTTTGHRASDFLLLHEFGHSFAGLADEYYTSDVAYSDYYDKRSEPREPNITTLVDFSSKWSDMMDRGTPVPTPMDNAYREIIGVYEGGGYSATDIYRPFQDCTMKSVLYDGFCPVCQRAILRMLSFYSE